MYCIEVYRIENTTFVERNKRSSTASVSAQGHLSTSPEHKLGLSNHSDQNSHLGLTDLTWSCQHVIPFESQAGDMVVQSPPLKLGIGRGAAPATASFERKRKTLSGAAVVTPAAGTVRIVPSICVCARLHCSPSSCAEPGAACRRADQGSRATSNSKTAGSID